MNNKGQLSLEYMLILSIILTGLILTTNTIQLEVEKNTILTSAKTGAQTGADKNNYAIYYNDTYNNYHANHPRLTYSNQIKIIKTELIQNKDNTLTIQTTAHTRSLNNHEKQIVSSRINYYIRETITKTYNKTSNTYYDPAYSNNYRITTKDVIWK